MSDMPIEMMQRKSGRPRAPRPKTHPTMIRVPVELRDHLLKCAEANYRSLTTEICARLDASIQGESFDEHGVIVRILRRPRK